MIVWSGQKNGVELATGGRYVPGYEVDADGDGFAACEDCDDSDPSRHPAATEYCDGIDNDCAGGVDDGFGVGQSCTAPVDECHQVVGVQECSWSGTATLCSGPTTLHDIAPPVLGLPDRLVIYATSPSGAAIPYSASASDACAGTVAVACSPSPGSTCPINSIGEVTTVSCTATDPQGNSASGGFEVHVAGAVEQLADLSLRVATCDLSDDMVKHVQKDIAEILKAIADGKSSQVCGKLQRFIDQIQALSAKKKPKVPLDEAGVLLEDATRIRAVLGC